MNQLRKHPQTATKHIFVTGGVVSSLGKGLTAASLGNLLTARGLRVKMQKLDPSLLGFSSNLHDRIAQGQVLPIDE